MGRAAGSKLSLATTWSCMDPSITGSNSPRVQFPQELPHADSTRPPPTRPLPRVGSSGRVPSTRSVSLSNDELQRIRTRSTEGSTSRPDVGTQISRTHGPSPLNPSRKRASGQHSFKRSDSIEAIDTSLYDLHDVLDHQREGEDACK